jgi:uncharacterized membrane protein
MIRGRVGPLAILIAMAVGIGLLATAMLRYPGGTALDPLSPGHSFWFNFLCDLTGDVAVNGRPNPGGSLARAAMIAFCVALACFWIVLPSRFRDRRRISTATKTFGVVSVLGLAAVPLATGLAHIAAVFASAIPALCAGVLGLIGTLKYMKSKALAALASATIAAGALDSVLYACSYLVHPRIVSPALPLFQRIATLLMLAWMAAVATSSLQRPPKPSPLRP